MTFGTIQKPKKAKHKIHKKQNKFTCEPKKKTKIAKHIVNKIAKHIVNKIAKHIVTKKTKIAKHVVNKKHKKQNMFCEKGPRCMTLCKANPSCCALRPHATPLPEEKSILGVIYGVLLWADMNAATPLGARGRSVRTAVSYTMRLTD